MRGGGVMSPLDKMAAAMADRGGRGVLGWPSWDQMQETTKEDWREYARAGLGAIRDPDAKAIVSGITAWHEVRTDSPYAAWVAMVDYIGRNQ